ncbi:hypothetical protein GY45DRAFT_1368648 [Cubamyces sp. BRFM 1775]|nr:hypothetical protein GY45DRAFT_1368648 [Cubamyces sp. BRFM 1775]
MAITRNNTPEHQDEEAPRVFRIHDRAVFFYLYGTKVTDREDWALTKEEQRDLEEQIVGHGGALCQSEREADTIITNEAGLGPLSDKYSFEQTQYVEPPEFVRLCIASGRYAHKPTTKRPMSGRYTGRTRTNFTEEDDRNLCKFLARTLPYSEAGGRKGIKPYLELVSKAQYDDLDYKWAARHPADSWRERYKGNQERFDPIIAQLVKENPPPPGDKGVWPYDRRMNYRSVYARISRPEVMAEWLDDEPEELPEGVEAHEQLPASPVRPRPRARHTLAGRARDRSAPPVEQGRGRVQSAPYPAQRASNRPRDHSLEEMGEFVEDEIEFWRDDDVRPGPEDAGPSGTQRSPIPPSPPRRQQQPQRPAVAPTAKGPAAARARRAVRDNPQVPASSQATLVGPVPTQLRGAAGAAKLPAPESVEEDEAPEPRRMAKRRKIQHRPVQPVVLLELLRKTGLGSRSAPQKAANAAQGPSRVVQPAPKARPAVPEDEDGNASEQDDEEENDFEQDIEKENGSGQDLEEEDYSEEDVEEGSGSDAEWLDDDVLPDPANAPQSHTTGPTMEDELEVEELVQTSAHASGRISLSQSEELDSDDQRSRAKLLPARPSGDGSRRMSQHELRRKEFLDRLANADDDETLAELLDLTRPANTQRAKSAASSSASTGASLPQPQAGPSRAQNPVTPVPVPRRKVKREETEGSTTSSAPDVPLPGTRASEEKRRIRESQRYEPYVPPPGTKAASAQKMQLRSRTIARRN